jgi:hypothetical protein
MRASGAVRVENDIRCAGYVALDRERIERQRKHASRTIPEGFDYGGVRHLRAEASEQLARIRPRTLGQAGRVSGITPADLALVLVYLEGRGARRSAAAPPGPLGRSVGRGQGCADVVAGTFFDAPCPKVGAGFQPAQAEPWAWTPRRLKTCGHFGRHPRGCRPRSGDCFMCSCDRVFRTRGRMLLGQASFAVRFAEIWWLSPFSFFTRGCPSESSARPRASPDCRSEVSGC